MINTRTPQTLEEMTELMDQQLGLEVVKELVEDATYTQPHEFVQMANVCIEILEMDGVDVDVYDKARETLINLMETFRVYGVRTCQKL